MPTKKKKTPKGDRSREHIYRTALGVLRKRGYAEASMRDLAQAAGLSLGAIYHYFPSKDAIVMQYYDESAALHEAALAARAPGDGIAERLDAIFQTKLETVVGDRKLLGVLFRAVGDPHHPLSPFSRKTAALRERNIALFEALLDGEPKRVSRPLARALWIVQLGLLLVLLHDGPDAARTRRLAHTLAKWIGAAWPLLRSPAAQPFLGELESLFRGKN